ncbi:MAG: hypothetical protein OEY94_07475 [Alphaproteobacteria bacterium]|nr:hypothetical protein [Alphaproteobacteria bacterium]
MAEYKEYTPEEITKIICQTDDRITANLRQNRELSSKNNGSWSFGLERIITFFEDFAKKGAEEKSLTNAEKELRAIGMSDTNIFILTDAVISIASREYHNAMTLAAANFGRGSLRAKELSISNDHHLGIRDMRTRDQELVDETRKVFEKGFYKKYLEFLTEEGKKKPNLLRTNTPGKSASETVYLGL